MDKSWAIEKLIVFFFLLCSVIISINYWYQRVSLVSRFGSKLERVIKDREKEILNLITSYKKNVAEIAYNAQFISLVKSLDENFVRGSLGDYKGTSSAYKKPEAQLDQWLNHYNHKFKDLFLINKDGIIFYVNKGEMINANLTEPSLRQSALALSFERTKITLTPDISEFAIDPLVKDPSLFILEPVFSNKKFLAVLAIQLDETHFYKVLQDYQQPGLEGDLYITKAIGDRILYLSPSRSYSNNIFKNISNTNNDMDRAAYKAAHGDSGFGKVRDKFDNELIAAWSFVPGLNWGLIAKISYTQAAQTLHFIRLLYFIFLVITLLGSFFLMYQFRNSHIMHNAKRYFFTARILKVAVWIAFTLCALFAAFLILKRLYLYRTFFGKVKESALVKIHSQAEFINQNILSIEKIAQEIANDLQTNTLKKEDISLRLARDLKEIPQLTSISVAFAPFAFDPEKRLYGIESQRTPEIKTNSITYDYMIPGSQEDPQSDWYNKTIKRGPFWTEPYYRDGKDRQMRYSIPFYNNADDKKPQGVVSVTYNLDKIIASIRAMEVGKTGYGILLSSNGTFIYHPVEQYVKNQISLSDIAREQNNSSLGQIAQKIIKEKVGFENYTEHNTKIQYWLAYATIPSVKWTVAAVFSQEALNLPVENLHQQLIWIFVMCVISLLLLALICSYNEKNRLLTTTRWAIFSSIIFAGAILIFWELIRRAPYQPPVESTIIRDQTNLDQYLEFLNLDTTAKNEQKPIVIPTGIILYTLSFSNTNQVSVSGYIWQRIKTEDRALKGIRFPEAANVSLKKVLEKEDAGSLLIGWNLSATFLQKNRFAWFPFDRVHLNMLIASANFERNILLVPDFSGYQSLDVDPLPGITNKSVIPGFALQRSFFSFSPLAHYDEIGLENLRKTSENIQLNFNVIFERKLTNPFIIFLLPLLIILFSIYAILLVTFRDKLKSDAFTALSSYTAIFFTLVILHQTLRNQYQAGELFYIEYFFFFTYITILLLIFYTLIMRLNRFNVIINKKFAPYLRIFFWPVQFGLWFIITMITFYRLR